MCSPLAPEIELSSVFAPKCFVFETATACHDFCRRPPAKLKTAQDAVDAGMMKTLKSGRGLSTMGKYMKTRFTLQKGQYPHDMKF